MGYPRKNKQEELRTYFFKSSPSLIFTVFNLILEIAGKTKLHP